MADEVRQKFEAWAKLHGDSCSRIRCCSEHTFRHERYDSVFTEWEWRSWQEAYSAGKRAGEIAQQEKIAEQILNILHELTPDDAKASDPIAVAYQRIGVLLLDDGAAPEEKKSTGTPQER